MSQTRYAINTFSYIWERPVVDCLRHLADQGHAAFEILLSTLHR